MTVPANGMRIQGKTTIATSDAQKSVMGVSLLRLLLANEETTGLLEEVKVTR